ncbi:YihY family inner membrane protein [Hydrogenovibrio kuenenii]|uniref:YihY family inner membrane protein n=1 Tax=Hydrogenovibrio kuenenii TaxID=63658 RepID=UPI000466A963|nr:YihY family inner membrane protein [Hydrogenovibrio kuenenii]
MKNYLVFQLIRGHFWIRTFRNFLQKDGLDAVTVLSYTSLVGVVPFLGVIVSVLSVTNYFKDQTNQILNQLLAHLLPSSSPLVERYLIEFSSHASHLKGIGIIFIFITSLMMLWAVDNKINAMWDKNMQRKLWVSLLSYFSIGLLGPLLLVLSFAITSVLPALNHSGMSNVLWHWVFNLPLLMNMLGFWFLFHYVPISRVNWRASFLGALIVTLLLEVLKLGFVFYVQWFPSYDLIYGAFAAVPLFLLWMYLVWMVIIIGASCVHELDTAYRALQKISE